MRWAGHAAYIAGTGEIYRILVGNREGKDHLEVPGIDGKIILIWISESGMWGYGMDQGG
jgi:hypothetical protein